MEGSPKWIKANVDFSAYYRVQYSVENWNALSRALLEDHETFSVGDRVNLIDDSFALAQLVCRLTCNHRVMSMDTCE